MDYQTRVQAAVEFYWGMRTNQRQAQETRGIRDQGLRGAVTGGKQMDGFIRIIIDLLSEYGIANDEIFYDSRLEIPGYYRPEKRWDILVVADHKLVAAIEFKSQASSFGNNFNNRVEEAVGSAMDLWTAYREGAFPAVPRPWLGYLMLLVESEKVSRPVSVQEPHFAVFEEFKEASYAKRFQILLTRLVRERLYDGTSLIMTPQPETNNISFSEPSSDLKFANFAESLRASVAAFQRARS